MNVKFIAATIVLACASSAALASPPPDFTCDVPAGTILDRDGYRLGEVLHVYGEKLALETYGDLADQLPLTDSHGAINYYSKDGVRVAVSPDSAQIELASGQVIPCTKHVDDGLMEGADGMSHGSTVRQAADLNGTKIDKLPEGEPVFIRENAGNNYQGYDWFLVEYSEGLKGYVWGGTLCSVGFKVPGIANECGKPF
ncbi:SH3 domain-containing protein [Lentilitoribacter sp. EG35]|jgi:hypothetical protein|uniref:SH3 domain-containing protein n=1 Tax=Lentilitoribacter sp. EG35 TaxID=3234192 RepID=UPI00345FADA1